MKIVLFFLFLATSMNSYGQFKADSTYKPLDVAILLYDGVELLDFAGPGEVFHKPTLMVKTLLMFIHVE
jgi:hypothetical protein